MVFWLVAVALARPPEVIVTGEAPPPPPAPKEAPAPTSQRWDAPSIIEDLGNGVAIDWTRLVLTVEQGAMGYGVGANRRAVEQEARRLVGPGMLMGARAVTVSEGLMFPQVEEDPVLGEATRSRVERWAVTEGRYFASGRVELLGELSLQELLKPWALGRALPLPAEPPGEGEPTGLVIDARGTGAKPAYSPRVLAPDGKVWFDPAMWEDFAIKNAPVVYVPGPDHPAVARAGASPITLKATEAKGSDLVVPALDRDLGSVYALRTGTIVVVIDP